MPLTYPSLPKDTSFLLYIFTIIVVTKTLNRRSTLFTNVQVYNTILTIDTIVYSTCLKPIFLK